MIPQNLDEETDGAVAQERLVRPWGSFLSEQLHKWKSGEIECGCRDMAMHVRQIVKEELEKENRTNADVDAPAVTAAPNPHQPS